MGPSSGSGIRLASGDLVKKDMVSRSSRGDERGGLYIERRTEGRDN